MARIAPVDLTQLTGPGKDLVDAVKAKMGAVPNIFKAMVQSPAVLDLYLKANGALAGGKLDPKTVEAIQLVVAQSNGCEYCLAAHTFIGGKVGLSQDDILSARKGTAANAKTAALVALAKAIVANRGKVSDAELQNARSAGWSDGEIVEVVGVVTVAILTNYFNNLAQPEVDFPAAAKLG